MKRTWAAIAALALVAAFYPLAAFQTPFLYVPLRNHFEQSFHVARRLDRLGAGTRMFPSSMPQPSSLAVTNSQTVGSGVVLLNLSAHADTAR